MCIYIPTWIGGTDAYSCSRFTEGGSTTVDLNFPRVSEPAAPDLFTITI